MDGVPVVEARMERGSVKRGEGRDVQLTPPGHAGCASFGLAA